jgi:hypothetical protein
LRLPKTGGPDGQPAFRLFRITWINKKRQCRSKPGLRLLTTIRYFLPGISIGVAPTDGFVFITGLLLSGISIGVAFTDGIVFTFGGGAPLSDGGETSPSFGIA